MNEMDLACHVFPYPPMKLWDTEAALWDHGVIIEPPRVLDFSMDEFSSALFSLVLPADKESESFAGGGWILEYLRFTGLSTDMAVYARNVRCLPHRDDQIPETHRSFVLPTFPSPFYSTLFHLRYFAKLAYESPSARRRFKGCMDHYCPDENLTILVLDAFDDMVSLNVWLPAPVLQAMGYAVLKNYILGPKYKPLALRNAELAAV
ncbi:hypothetical protein HF673_01310 [Acidithiobacillus thiooxidans]|nr:hypothetical protein [Acidithiobacillus thiooxidans]MBU2834454.1 hypothetical protein [Acidithiobacillus thiooxidans]